MTNLWDDVLVHDTRANVVRHLDPLARWMLALTSTANYRLVASDLPSPSGARRAVCEGTPLSRCAELTRVWDPNWLSILGAFGSRNQIEIYLPLLKPRLARQSGDPHMLTSYLWRGAIIHHRLEMLHWLSANAARLGLVRALENVDWNQSFSWALRVRDAPICQWLWSHDATRTSLATLETNPYVLAMAQDTEDVPFLGFVDTLCADIEALGRLFRHAYVHALKSGRVAATRWFLSHDKMDTHTAVCIIKNSMHGAQSVWCIEKLLDGLCAHKPPVYQGVEAWLRLLPSDLTLALRSWCRMRFSIH